VFGPVDSLQNVAVIISLQIVPAPGPLLLLELPPLLFVLVVVEVVLVVVWAAAGDVANTNSTMRDASLILKNLAQSSRRSASHPLHTPYNTSAGSSFSHCQKLIGAPLAVGLRPDSAVALDSLFGAVARE
jgi:hypothetical protein